jgi:hypothetical protein
MSDMFKKAEPFVHFLFKIIISYPLSLCLNCQVMVPARPDLKYFQDPHVCMQFIAVYL